MDLSSFPNEIVKLIYNHYILLMLPEWKKEHKLKFKTIKGDLLDATAGIRLYFFKYSSGYKYDLANFNDLRPIYSLAIVPIKYSVKVKNKQWYINRERIYYYKNIPAL